jgi:CheY-like chemotaxis protein/HPt (histidine-containing phosphotransfer) domain-containing protein
VLNDPRADGRFVVLLVDDQQFVGAAVRQLLATETDIDFHHCTQAVEAIPYANRIGPTVILQDLMMPDVDGFTLVRMYRLNPTTARVPVIVLSGNDDAATRTRALGDGAVDYIVKLPKKADLVACIRRHASPGAGAIAQPTPAPAPKPVEDTLDRAVLESLSEMGSPEFARGLIDQFVAEAAACVQTLVGAASRREGHTLKATAHSLKGSSMIVGATKLARLCGQIDSRLALDPGDLGAADLAADVEQEFGRVREALSAGRASSGR